VEQNEFSTKEVAGVEQIFNDFNEASSAENI
jgi:hypothetical protein